MSQDTTYQDPQVAVYAARVRAHLADLQEDAREELLEDLELHLGEVVADEGGDGGGAVDLEGRLGPPDRYAAELRASAGLPAPPPGRNRWERVGDRLSALPLVAAARRHRDRLRDHPRVDEWVSAARAGAPLWWAVRGYLIVLAWGLMTSGSIAVMSFPVPRVGGSRGLGLLLTVAAVAASVALGRREQGRPAHRYANRGVDVVAVLLLLAAAGTIRSAGLFAAYPPRYEVHTEPVLYAQEGALVGPDGQVITNLHPFDADGEPLEDVFLYDQDGRPVSMVVTRTPEGAAVVTSYPISVDGRPLTWVFPQRQGLLPGAEASTDADPGAAPTPEVPQLRGTEPSPSPDPTPTASPTAEASPPADDTGAAPGEGEGS